MAGYLKFCVILFDIAPIFNGGLFVEILISFSFYSDYFRDFIISAWYFTNISLNLNFSYFKLVVYWSSFITSYPITF